VGLSGDGVEGVAKAGLLLLGRAVFEVMVPHEKMAVKAKIAPSVFN
jgi:hypothetical protein